MHSINGKIYGNVSGQLHNVIVRLVIFICFNFSGSRRHDDLNNIESQTLSNIGLGDVHRFLFQGMTHSARMASCFRSWV
jgi:hypothetical protein